MTNVEGSCFRTTYICQQYNAIGMFVQNVPVSEGLVFQDRSCETEAKTGKQCL